jgi:putative phosphoribosyl transferase
VTARLPFADRTQAGQLLARRLEHLRSAGPLVLALPRGGVPVGFEIARSLGAELDVLMVRKLGAPGQPEYAIGAIVDGDQPQLVLTSEAAGILESSPGYLEREKARQLAELVRRRQAYIGSRAQPAFTRRCVIIVDDGVATGATIIAAISGIRKAGPARIVLAVPVAPKDTARQLERLADECVVLATPEPFLSVGRHYRDFSEVSDAEVVQLLADAQAFVQPDCTYSAKP